MNLVDFILTVWGLCFLSGCLGLLEKKSEALDYPV